MENKLKTLKDLENDNKGKSTCADYGFELCVNPSSLRQEAIKHLKKIDKNNCPIKNIPKRIFNEEFDGCPAGDCQGCGAYWWIRYFFNLTEEDLR